jgi:hypothetical protein
MRERSTIQARSVFKLWTRAAPLVFLLSSWVPSASSSDSFGCEQLLKDDVRLVEALPERIRRILENERTAKWIQHRESSWVTFHRALDRGLRLEGHSFSSRIDDLSIQMRFKRTAPNSVQLQIELLRRDGLNIGEQSINGKRFLDLIVAQLAWFADARKIHGIEHFEIVGENLQNKKLIDALKSMGFEKTGKSFQGCAMIGTLVGVSTLSVMAIIDQFFSINTDTIATAFSSTFALTSLFCVYNQGPNLGLKISLPRQAP